MLRISKLLWNALDFADCKNPHRYRQLSGFACNKAQIMTFGCSGYQGSCLFKGGYKLESDSRESSRESRIEYKTSQTEGSIDA